MSFGWNNHEPSPIEFMHGRIVDLFHQWRRAKTNRFEVEIDGIELNNIVAAAKMETYKKYPKQKLDKAIPKSEM